MSELKGRLKVNYNDEYVIIHPETTSDEVLGLDSAILNIIPQNVHALSKEYAVGDVVYDKNLPSWAYLECTTAGTSAASEVSELNSSVTEGQSITDGTATWIVRKVGNPNPDSLKDYATVVRDTAENFASNNTVLKDNEIGLETDTGKIKIGDGTTAWNDITYSGGGSSSGGSTIRLADVTNASAVADASKVSLKWTDPDNLTLNDAALATWAGTKVIRKAGSAPENENDGTVVLDSTTKNAYASTAYVDTTVENGTTYYYMFCPYSTDGAVTAGTVVNGTPNLYKPTITLSETAVDVISPANLTKTVTVTSNSSGAFTVASSNEAAAKVAISGSTVTITYVADGKATVTITQAAAGDYAEGSATIAVTTRTGYRYGFKIAKNESDPKARVTYLYDAVGMTPSSITLSTSGAKPDLGSWGDVWFVKDNKPLMLKQDGTVDYYLYKNNYAHKAGLVNGKYADVDVDSGVSSDVANTSYNGNAMAQIPLCWVYRYEDSNYIYTIVSDVKFDDNYKAYAHTGSDGTVHDYFYWSLFMGSGSTSKIRSISGQDILTSTKAEQETTACKANNSDTTGVNGKGWYTHTWSQWTLLQTLLVLISKSTNTQESFGYGYANGSSSDPNTKSGALIDKGQFFGYSAGAYRMKAFHIEDLWGMYWDRVAGLMSNNGHYYVKMTPEGDAYRITDTTGMTQITSPTLPASGWLKNTSGSEYGFLPSATSGSDSTYYCDYFYQSSGLNYLIAGASANDPASNAGAFYLDLLNAPSLANWPVGCGLSYINS